jgi:hypothetical protein
MTRPHHRTSLVKAVDSRATCLYLPVELSDDSTPPRDSFISEPMRIPFHYILGRTHFAITQREFLEL